MSLHLIDIQNLAVHLPPDVHLYVHVIIMPFTKSASLASAPIRHILLENYFVPPFFSPTPQVSDD